MCNRNVNTDVHIHKVRISYWYIRWLIYRHNQIHLKSLNVRLQYTIYLSANISKM